MTLLPPVTFQGGKVRLAEQIVKRIGLPISEPFFDLCCGSGAVAVAAVNAGQAPQSITMIDASPWGLFWEAIGNGTFDLDRFQRLIHAVPTDPSRIKAFMERLYQEPAGDEAPYRYLLLQAAAIGGKSISLDGDRWVRGSGFRDYWLPTETSSRRSPVNPMMPMPTTILQRVTALATQMRGVVGRCVDLTTVTDLGSRGRAYIDPPYAGLTGYGQSFDVVAVAQSLAIPCWVSEGRPLTPVAVQLSKGRAKGGITGDRKRRPNEEWLSKFTPGAG